MSPSELQSLKKFFRENGIRQEEVAEDIGVTQEQLSRILNGKASGRSTAARILSDKYAHKIRPVKAQTKCKAEIAEAALGLWDGTPSSAEQVIAFLISAKDLRGA